MEVVRMYSYEVKKTLEPQHVCLHYTVGTVIHLHLL